MLTECFIAATESVKPPVTHLSSSLKDVGVFLHEFQPQSNILQGFKKSSIAKNCLAVSETHIFAAQAGKAIINVYNREKNNQESAVPFPQKITSIAYAHQAAVLVIGTQDGKLILWEIATGRVSNTSASHIESVTLLEISPCGEYIVSGSPDSTIHIWSIRSLVNIESEQNAYGSTRSMKDPASTFSHHRSAVEALAIGHASRASSNIVASASNDKTCYIWNLENLTILRTILLVQTPQCSIFDPADRAVYFGSIDGSVQAIDLLSGQRQAASILATPQQDAITAIQLDSQDCWTITGSSTSDPAQCITMSYDGTSLVTGHYSGILIEWDIGKRRMGRQISILSGQSVTNTFMLQPMGLDSGRSQSGYIVPTVIKPRLELSSASNGQSGAMSSVPADYTLNVRVTRKAPRYSEITQMLSTSEIPQNLIDDAIQSLIANKVSRAQPKQVDVQSNGHPPVLVEPSLIANKVSRAQPKQVDVQSNGHSDEIQKELTTLKAKLARHEELDQARLERHIARTKRREALGLQKRQAFFAAKKQGKNGDEAMKKFSELERGLDEESDEEALDGQADTPMLDK